MDQKGKRTPQKHENVTQAVYNLLNRYRLPVGSKLAQYWIMILGPDKAEPDVTLSHPVYSIYQGYLVSPAFLVVEVRSYGQTLPYLVNKCKNRYHRAGIPYCWIVDADNQTGYKCQRESPHPQQVEALTAGPIIKVTVAQIFEEAAKL